jgi:hypothetical protein
LHCIHAAHLGLEVSPKIPVKQVAAAIKWVEYTTQQALSINLEVCSPDALESNLVRIISLAERKGGAVSAREVSKSFDSKYRPSAQKIQEWFTELATMNYGEVTSKGQSILFSLTKTSPSSPVGWKQGTATVTGGDTNLPTVSPPSPLTNISSPFTQSSGEEWGGSGDTNLPTFKSLPDKDLSSSGEDGEVFTPFAESSRPLMMSCTTKISPEDTQKLRDIALIWWPEYYPEQLQNLLTQMYGWNAPGTKYDVAVITAWLTTQDELIRDRITELVNQKKASLDR